MFEGYLVGFEAKEGVRVPERELRNYLNAIRKADGEARSVLKRGVLEVHITLPATPVDKRAQAHAERVLGEIAKALEVGGWQVYVHCES